MSPSYRFGDFTLSVGLRELRRAATPVSLSPRAFDCLAYLIAHRDRAVGKDELIGAIWNRVDVSDTQLGQTVLRARRAIGDDGQSQHAIRTVSRFGYRWVAEVAVVDAGIEPIAHGATETAPAAAPLRAGAEGDAEALSPAHVRRGRRGLGIAFGIAAAIALLALAAWLQDRAAPFAHDGAGGVYASAAVLPADVEAGGQDDAWLRLGAMDLIAERLREGGLAVPSSDSIVGLLQGPSADARTSAAERVRRATQAALVVSVRLARRGGGWIATLQAEADDRAAVQVTATRPDPLDAARDASDRLLARLGRPRLPPATAAGGLQQRLQRAQASLLANDLDTARAILVSDPDLARAEPQLGYRLAQVDFRAGDYARAQSALTALLTEAAANDPLFRARLLNARGAARIRQDDFAGAERDYDLAATLLRGGEHAPELGLALTGRGIARSTRRDFTGALADFGAARSELQAAGDALAVARVDGNLGGLEMNRDRPAQALPYLTGAADVFERYGAVNELLETLESLVSDNLALLQPAEALAASDRAWLLAARVTDPNQRLNLTLDRADVFLALGRLGDAGRLLAGLPAAVPAAHPFLARRLPALRARLAWLEGRYVDAAASARAALALPPAADDAGEGSAEIALVAQRAALAAESPRLPPRPSTDAPSSTAPDRYPVQAVADAEWADATGDEAAAALDYRTARDLAERHGEPSDLALVAASYGRWLLRRRQWDLAGEVIGRVSPWASRDFDCALLQLQFYRALGKSVAAESALAQTRALAGERRIPPALLMPSS